MEGALGSWVRGGCWLVVTDNGAYAYAANTGSDTITGFAVEADGSLSILDEDGVTAVTGDVAVDLALSDGSQFLYSLGAGSDTISVFRIESGGALSLVQTVTGLPAASVGLAAA